MAVAPELIPEGELVLTRLLVPFMWLCCCIVGLAVANGADTFARAFFGTLNGSLGWIPLFGKVASRPIDFVAHKINSYIAGWEQYFDARIGEAFHSLAQLLHIITRDTYDTGETLYFAARRFTHLLARIEHIGSTSKAQGRHAVTQAQVKPIVRTVHEHTARLAHTAPAAVLPRLGRLEGELEHVIEWDIPRLQARTRAIEHGLSRLFKWTRAHPLAIGETVAIAAVAHALGKLGGSWIRCRNWRRIGKSVCGLPFALIEELFAGAIVTFAVLDICDFAAAAQSIAQAFVPELMALVDVEDALIGCHGATAAPLLTLPALHLPPTTLGLRLAA